MKENVEERITISIVFWSNFLEIDGLTSDMAIY